MGLLALAISNPLVALGGVAALGAAAWGAYGYVHHEGFVQGITQEKALWDAAEQARLHDDIRRSDQLSTAVEALRKEKDDEIAAINARATSDADELRKRTDIRLSEADAARTRCTGATGRELSRPDAQFLTGQIAARAQRQQVALDKCYKEIDQIRISLSPAK